LVRRGCARLRDVPGVLVRSRDDGPCGIVACQLPGARPGDVGFVLAESGIYVRAGGHCVGVPGGVADDAELIRLSAHIYNTGDEMDRACAALARIAGEGG
jgi:selenocysteine lyase/cysteine desulfurase